MPQYVSIRFYKLRDDADPAAFEEAFREAPPTWGIERIMLLRGFKADTHPLAPSEYDYGSVHVYSDLDDAVKTVEMAGDLAEQDEIPDALQPFVRFWQNRACRTDRPRRGQRLHACFRIPLTAASQGSDCS